MTVGRVAVVVRPAAAAAVALAADQYSIRVPVVDSASDAKFADDG